jgi:hypothetical protein
MFLLYYYYYGSFPSPFSKGHNALLNDFHSLNEGEILGYDTVFNPTEEIKISALCEVRTGLLESRHRQNEVNLKGISAQIIRPGNIQAYLTEPSTVDKHHEVMVPNEKHLLSENDLLVTFVNQFAFYDASRIFMSQNKPQLMVSRLVANHFFYIISPIPEELDNYGMSLSYFKLALRLKLDKNKNKKLNINDLKKLTIPNISTIEQQILIQAFNQLDEIESAIQLQRSKMTNRFNVS